MTPVRTVLYATLGAIVLVVAAWMFFIYRPRGDEIAGLEEQITQAEDLESSLQAQVARLQELDEERPSVEAELRQLTAAVPPDPELATLILTLHDEATRSGIDFLQFTPSPPTAGEETSVISAGLNVSGSFFTVLDFLDRVEALDRIVVIDSLELTAAEPEAVTEEDEGEAASETASASEAGADNSGTGTTVDASEIVTIATEFGEVTTDSASLDDEPDGEGSGEVGAALVRPEPLRFPVGAFDIQMTLQVRTFTTASPAGAPAEGETTATTAPPANGVATTTTTPEGGG